MATEQDNDQSDTGQPNTEQQFGSESGPGDVKPERFIPDPDMDYLTKNLKTKSPEREF